MAVKGSIPERKDVQDRYKWRLEDIYPDNEKWESDFSRVKEIAAVVGSFKGRVGESARSLLAVLQEEERLLELLEKVYAYARMRRDEDNANSLYQAMTDRAETLNTAVQAALSFIAPEILAIPEEVIENYFREEQDLALYRFALDEVLRQKEHTLSTAEEQIIASAGEVAQAPAGIFIMFNNADLTFPAILDEQGRSVEVTSGRYIQLMESRERRVRMEAFRALYSTYGKFKNTLSATLSSSVKRDIFYARVRRFPSALHASLFTDNIPVEVYNNLIRTVRSRLGSMHRYTVLRKKLLGLDELHMYDLYVPVDKNVEWKIPYPQAVQMVKDGLASLGESYVGIMSGGLDEGWVDVYENRGKTSGAYSWGPYGVHPYILMNYQDNLNNLFTLAHEAGHAVHSYYANLEQPYVYAHYKIFTAEVASTVNESLLMDSLIGKEKDQAKKTRLLNHYLEQFRGTLFRQTMFAEFEKIIHDTVEKGGALTPDLLCRVYHQLNVDYYGPSVVVDDEISLEWARIPHFYTAFYVYKYATGFSAATALTRHILEEGGPAVSRYIEFLKKGGSGYPLDLLKLAGVDMTSPKPVEEALDLFDRLLDQMEALAF